MRKYYKMLKPLSTRVINGLASSMVKMLPSSLRWSQTQAAYVDWASKPLDETYLEFIRRRGAMFADFVGEPGIIIDVGCGNGVIGGMTYAESGYAPLRRGSYPIYGIDPLPLKAPIPWLNFYNQIKCEDVDQTTLRAEVATFITTFDHIEDPETALMKLSKIGVKKIYLWETLWIRPVNGDWYHSHRYTYPQLEKILEKADYSIIRSVRVDATRDVEGWFIEADKNEEFGYQWRNIASPELECNEKRVWELLGHTGLPRGFFTGKRCLDAGCGTGRWTYAMQRMGATVDSFDISEPAVEATRKINLSTHKLDIMDLEPDPRYDFVLCWGVLHHLEYPYEGFKRLVSQVKPGGLLHVMVYHRDTQKVYEEGRAKWLSLTNDERLSLCRTMAKRYRGGVHGWWDAYNPRYNWSYHEDEIKKWFMDSGFKDVKLVEKYSINMIGCKTP